jgi:hypothetical protein
VVGRVALAQTEESAARNDSSLTKADAGEAETIGTAVDVKAVVIAAHQDGRRAVVAVVASRPASWMTQVSVQRLRPGPSVLAAELRAVLPPKCEAFYGILLSS